MPEVSLKPIKLQITDGKDERLRNKDRGVVLRADRREGQEVQTTGDH